MNSKPLDAPQAHDMTTPTLTELQWLDGRVVSTLDPREIHVLEFGVAHARKLGVYIVVTVEADPAKLAAARSAAEADAILQAADQRVSVTTAH